MKANLGIPVVRVNDGDHFDDVRSYAHKCGAWSVSRQMCMRGACNRTESLITPNLCIYSGLRILCMYGGVGMRVGEIWLANGLWPHEQSSVVRIEELLESGGVDVNYELDRTKTADLRILPRQLLVRRVEEAANGVCKHGTPPNVICGQCQSTRAPARCGHGNIHDGPIACRICLKAGRPPAVEDGK